MMRIALRCLVLIPIFAVGCVAEDAPAKKDAEPELLKPRDDVPGVANFAKISDALYRGAQPTAAGMAELKKLGIKTVVNLRMMHSDRDELKGLGLRYGHINCKAWHPEDEDVARFLKIMANKDNHPVFVHCLHGADRTGMMVASYRIVEQGWKPEHAAKETHNFGFHKVFNEIQKYLKKFDCEKLKQCAEKEEITLEIVM